MTGRWGELRLSEWRALLDIDSRKSRSDTDFWAICPCHLDHEASLHVTVGGDGQIVMKCFVCGSDRKDVAERLGYKLSDVAVDAITGEADSRLVLVPKKSKREKAGKKAKPFKVGDVWNLSRGKAGKIPFKIVKVYEYATAEGQIVLRKARLEAFDSEGKRIEKSFAVQSLREDGAWASDDGGYGELLYREDELASARDARGEVILCEGEKDADNLRMLGFVATTAQHGAGTGKTMEGKWSAAQTEKLLGLACVTLLPDRDAPGEAFMEYVAAQLYAAGQRCRIVQIREAWPEMPAKGDFTDWALHLKAGGVGKQALLERFGALLATAPDWNPDGVRIFTVPQTRQEKPPLEEAKQNMPHASGDREQDWDDYYGLQSYGVKWGKLCTIDKSGAKILADFVPTLTKIVQRDDGDSVSMEFVITATAGEGEKLRHLPPTRIQGVPRLRQMDWPVESWGAVGRIAPGARTAGQVYDALLRSGQKTSETSKIYAHTGMAEVNGVPCYLFNGGAVGADGVSVELRNNLRYYDLSDNGRTAKEGAEASWLLCSAIPDRIILPLMAQAFLAPLYSVMEEMDMPPSYVVYVSGQTGAYKSSLVSYVMAHFGRFYNRRFPASFEDTANSARDKCFICKDSLYVVDDYNPQSDRRAMQRMDGVANAVITAIADRAERGGLTASKELREERPARCTCIMTGEQLPSLGQGRVLRLYVISVAAGEIAPNTDQLRPFAEMATAGYYRASMRGYIQSLLARWDGIREEISQRLDRCQQTADARLDRQWGRMNHAAANLLLGCELMLDYFVRQGVLKEGQLEAERERCWLAIETNIIAQTAEIRESTPARQWISALRSLTRTRQVNFADLVEENPDRYMAEKVGWMDGGYYYVEADMADRAIRQLWKDSGVEVGMSNKQIHRQMMEMGLLRAGQGADGKPTPGRAKSIAGKTRRVLWIPRNTLDGEDGEEEPEETEEAIPEVFQSRFNLDE